jgi:hypothetical protein
MSIVTTVKSPYYFFFGQIFIISDEEGAQEAMARCPDLPVVNQKTIDLIKEFLSAKSTAEGKLKLLGDVIQEMTRTELVEAL